MMVEPIRAFGERRVNSSLHGRSVHRPENVPGHNVFKGYSTWAENGHVGVGDALDLFCAARTPVCAPGDCIQTRHSNDESPLEVIYLMGAGWLAVYAHVNASHTGTGQRYDEGDVVANVRGDLSDPRLHFELWMEGTAISDSTPGRLQAAMQRLWRPAYQTRIKDVGTGGVLATLGGKWVLAVGGDHSTDQGAIYLERRQ